MLNMLWAFMILIGIVVAAFTGNMAEITNGGINSAAEAVTVCLKMAGIVAMWSGLMRIGEKSGLVKGLTKKMLPLLSLLFPRLEKDSEAMGYIATNFIANILGLGWASTPAGLKAMEELQKLNNDKKLASREMCMFMIINMSSLQLITPSIIAYRSQYNSANPSEIIGPGFFATLISSASAIFAAKIMEIVSIRRAERKRDY